MVFGPNDSPLAGRAGKAVTGRVIGDRLQAEAETSVSLKVNALPGRGGGGGRVCAFEGPGRDPCITERLHTVKQVRCG